MYYIHYCRICTESVLPLVIGIVLMVGTLFGIKYLMKNIGVRDKKDKVQ